MRISKLSRPDLKPLPVAAGAVIAAAGWLSLAATYWDDAWHTDIGRDSAWTPPHVLLYGAVAVAGVMVAWWVIASVASSRSLASLTWPPLLLAGAGGVGVLAAAPIDAAWHAAYGRDAVLWSPPHMLTVFGSVAMLTGVLAGLAPARSRVLEAALSGLLLGTLAVAVMEYDTDVPQFSEVLYLPVLLAAGLLAVAVVRALVPRRLAVTSTAAAYVAVRLAIIPALAALGRSTPALPVAICGLAAADLPRLRGAARYAAAAGAVSVLAWAGAAAGLAPQSPAAVARTAIPVIAASAAIAAVSLSCDRRRTWLAVAALAAAAVALIPARPAQAHDPGEGTQLAIARLTVSANGRGVVRLTIVPQSRCSQLQPREIMARRAGRTIRAPLVAAGRCRFSGDIRLPGAGRWFVYAELSDAGRPAETWLPADPAQAATATASRVLYRPARAAPGSARRTETAAGAAIYAAGIALLGGALVVARRVARRRGRPSPGLPRSAGLSTGHAGP